MQNNNAQLKTIAKACNLHFEADGAACIYVTGWGETNRAFNPLASNDDCMRMCSALKLGTKHGEECVECFLAIEDSYETYFASTPLAEHGDDRLAAWRDAAFSLATMVTSEVV